MVFTRTYNPPKILDRVAAAGHTVFATGEHNANIIGVRTASRVPGAFDDWMHLVWQVKEKWEHYRWPITTDPGLYWLENPMNVDGTAILAPGQYRGAYRIGKHRDDYQAVVQTGGEVAVYRDDDRNALLDPTGDLFWGYFGINHHRASALLDGSKQVGKWSAGCQVFADPDDFAEYLRLVKITTSMYGLSVTYTLLSD